MERIHTHQRTSVIIRLDDFKDPEMFAGIVDQIYYGNKVSPGNPDELEITVDGCIAVTED